MGQPVDHSARTAGLAARLAGELGIDAQGQGQVACVALLRWSGCTANASEVARLLGDDVNGRLRMMVAGLPSHLIGQMGVVAQIHCEVSGDVAKLLGLPRPVVVALRRIFESLNGEGQPQGLRGSDVPIEVQLVQAAGFLEIHSRLFGLDGALSALTDLGGKLFPATWLPVLRSGAADWLQSLLEDPGSIDRQAQVLMDPLSTVPLELIADVIDLKLPWMTGYSRRVAAAAVACADRMGLKPAQRRCIGRASLIHGLGRAAVPNEVWNRSIRPGESDQEQLRLVPYWTSRAARRISNLSAEAELASYADERLDGTGAFRGVGGEGIGVEARVLAAAAHWTLLQTTRPGRVGMSVSQATAHIVDDANGGLFDPRVVAALISSPATPDAYASTNTPTLLSAREVEVLRCVSCGQSNKEAARTLGISPSTVRTHLEHVFQKLDCSTRAAATLKALTAGLL